MNYFYIMTFGCKVNQYESQIIREEWILRGGLEVTKIANAKYIIINSCAITAKAITDLVRNIRKIHTQNNLAKIIILGCAIKSDEESLNSLPGVSLLVAKDEIEKLYNFLGKKNKTVHTIENYNRARAVLKIQDGCNHKCAYCIIPSTRGASRSKPISVVLQETRQLLQAKIPEITYCGINLRQYGLDLEESTNFWSLMEKVEQEFGLNYFGKSRIRLSSLDPADFNDKSLQVLMKNRFICPHLHLSLQSGSSQILSKMGRGHYSLEKIVNYLHDLQKIWPIFALGADIITGFPGETEDLFEQTVQYLQKIPISYLHVFPFSVRKGTKAEIMPNQIPVQIRQKRAKKLREIAELKKQKFMEKLLQLPRLTMIVEKKCKGMCEYYVPCLLPESNLPERTIIQVKPERIEKNYIIVKSL